MPLNAIQRQLGHASLGTTSIYLRGSDTEEIIATVHGRRAPNMSASQADASTAPIPLAELLEVVGRWPHEAAELAAKVTVPVQYLAFEFERLWCIDADLVRSFAAYFTAAQLVVSELMAGIGHNADHHRNSHAFHLRQLAFALGCAQRTGRPLGRWPRQRSDPRMEGQRVIQVSPRPSSDAARDRRELALQDQSRRGGRPHRTGSKPRPSDRLNEQ